MNAASAYAIAIAVAGVTLYGAARLFSREPEARRVADDDEAGGAELRVVSRIRLGRGRDLVVVETEGRRILLGSTRAQWTALADLGWVGAGEPHSSLDAIEAELSRAFQMGRFGRGRRER